MEWSGPSEFWMIGPMIDGARTPEELESLLEDTFVLRDRSAISRLFEKDALLAPDDAGEARGREEITRLASRMWDWSLTYVAEPLRILQAGDIALVLGHAGAAVMRRGVDGAWRYVISVPSLLSAVTARSTKEVLTMGTDDYKALVRRELEAVNTGDFAAFDELIADHYLSHDPALPEPIRGPGGVRAQFEAYRRGGAFTVRIEDQVAEDDKVVTRWTASGRHDGELFGAAPTGRQLRVSGISIERFKDGKIVEDWTVWDALGLMRQLGVVPEGEPASATA